MGYIHWMPYLGGRTDSCRASLAAQIYYFFFKKICACCGWHWVVPVSSSLPCHSLHELFTMSLVQHNSRFIRGLSTASQKALRRRALASVEGSRRSAARLPSRNSALLLEQCYSTSSIAMGNDEDWIPLAYREFSEEKGQRGDSREGGDRSRHDRPSFRRGDKGGPRSRRPERLKMGMKEFLFEKRRKREVREAKEEAHRDMSRFEAAALSLRNNLQKYRCALLQEKVQNDTKSDTKLELHVQAPHDVNNSKVQNFSQELQTEVDKIGNLPQVQRELLAYSDDLFRSVCRQLQDTAVVACAVYRHNTQREAVAFVECAEACLRALKKLRAHRAVLFEQWQKEDETVGEDPVKKPAWIAPFSGVAEFISKKIYKLAGAKDEETVVDKALLAHEDADLAPSQQSFLNLVEAFTSASVLYPDYNEKMVGLIDLLPEESVPEWRTLLSIMEVLCHSGTLEAAQKCNRLFERYSPDVPHLPFNMVLRAYLEAGRKEKTRERKYEIVQDCLRVFEARWDVDQPRHKDERVFQASIVLHCIAVSGICEDCEIVKVAESVVKRCLEDSVFAVLSSAPMTVGVSVDSQPFVPLVNFLARVYASSCNYELVSKAKLMIQNILPGAQARYVRYPNVETINTILDGILGLYQETDDGMTLDPSADLEFIDSLLTYAMSRSESGAWNFNTWTNEETFHHIMDLYTTLKPENVGERMEELVSHYETRAYFFKSSELSITLATYNQVLWALWEEAKVDQPRRASQRALSLLKKLQVISTPLLLTQKELATIPDYQLYHLELRPNIKTYELVLNVCADTAAPSEFEMAAEVAYDVMQQQLESPVIMYKKTFMNKIKTCLDRLPAESKLRTQIEELLSQLSKRLRNLRKSRRKTKKEADRSYTKEVKNGKGYDGTLPHLAHRFRSKISETLQSGDLT